MKKITITLVSLILIFEACTNDSNNDMVNENTQRDSFKYNLESYNVKYKNNDYLILLNENDFYYLLEGIGSVKNKQDYFSNRKEIKKKPIELDSTLFSNFKSLIIFVDSCDKILVSEWVKKIESNPLNLHHEIKVDTSVNGVNLNNIYYGLIKDSFKIYEEDLSGKYILSR